MRITHLILLWPVVRTIARPLPQAPTDSDPSVPYDPSQYPDIEGLPTGEGEAEGEGGFDLTAPLAGLGAFGLGMKWDPMKNGWNPLKPKTGQTGSSQPPGTSADKKKSGINPFRRKPKVATTGATAGTPEPVAQSKTGTPGQVAQPKRRILMDPRRLFQKVRTAPPTGVDDTTAANRRFTINPFKGKGKTATAPPITPQLAPQVALDPAPLPPTTPEIKTPVVESKINPGKVIPDAKDLPDLNDKELEADMDVTERNNYERCMKRKVSFSSLNISFL